MTMKRLFRRYSQGIPGSGNRQKAKLKERAYAQNVKVSDPGLELSDSRVFPGDCTKKEARKGNFYIPVEFLKSLGPKSVQLTHIYVPLTAASHPLVKLQSASKSVHLSHSLCLCNVSNMVGGSNQG